MRLSLIKLCIGKKKCVHANGVDAKAKTCRDPSNCNFAHKCPGCGEDVPTKCKGAIFCAKAKAEAKK